MESLQTEIREEMRRSRLDKDRLYSLLLKIVETTGGEGSVGPAGPVGPVGPAGVCQCKCVKEDVVEEAPVKVATTVKKVLTKKKTVA